MKIGRRRSLSFPFGNVVNRPKCNCLACGGSLGAVILAAPAEVFIDSPNAAGSLAVHGGCQLVIRCPTTGARVDDVGLRELLVPATVDGYKTTGDVGRAVYQALAKPLPAATINAVLRLPPARRDELCGRRDLNELCRLKIRDLLPPIDAVRVEAFTATTLTLGLVAQTA
mmetsp:Transcript_17065/g.52497  ORF Transcript_17065/g.52497 Transcript_17065/m.52497 type:complete len:170 (+) Transcript_17065:109-618(+)